MRNAWPRLCIPYILVQFFEGILNKGKRDLRQPNLLSKQESRTFMSYFVQAAGINTVQKAMGTKMRLCQKVSGKSSRGIIEASFHE